MARVEFTIDSSPEAPALARTRLDALIGELPRHLLHDLRVVISELVTNAVKFGPDGDVEVEVEVGPDWEIRGEVRDRGEGGARVLTNSTMGEGGLGLQIVDTICSQWGNKPGTGIVWFEIAPE